MVQSSTRGKALTGRGLGHSSHSGTCHPGQDPTTLFLDGVTHMSDEIEDFILNFHLELN